MTVQGPGESDSKMTPNLTLSQRKAIFGVIFESLFLDPEKSFLSTENVISRSGICCLLAFHKTSTRKKKRLKKRRKIYSEVQKSGDHPNFRKNALGVKRPFSELSESFGVFSEQLSEFEIPFSEYEIPFSEWHPTT